MRLTHVYLILSQNPQGAFTTATGKTVDVGKAKEKLDRMAQHLGELIDQEKSLLTGAVSDTEKRLKSLK